MRRTSPISSTATRRMWPISSRCRRWPRTPCSPATRARSRRGEDAAGAARGLSFPELHRQPRRRGPARGGRHPRRRGHRHARRRDPRTRRFRVHARGRRRLASALRAQHRLLRPARGAGGTRQQRAYGPLHLQPGDLDGAGRHPGAVFPQPDRHPQRPRRRGAQRTLPFDQPAPLGHGRAGVQARRRRRARPGVRAAQAAAGHPRAPAGLSSRSRAGRRPVPPLFAPTPARRPDPAGGAQRHRPSGPATGPRPAGGAGAPQRHRRHRDQRLRPRDPSRPLRGGLDQRPTTRARRPYSPVAAGIR